MPRDIATMGGFGVDFALVVQGLDQLKDHYGEARGTILSNCAYKWFCNLNDLDSAKYLSDTLGKKTVETTSTSSSTSFSGQGSSSTSGTTHGETARSLLNPDEILNLGQGRGHRPPAERVTPITCSPIDYWNLPTFFRYLRQDHPILVLGTAADLRREPLCRLATSVAAASSTSTTASKIPGEPVAR